MSDRFIGRAEPRPPREDLYEDPTETLLLPRQRRRRPVGLVLGLIAGAFILLLIGLMAGWVISTGTTRGTPGAVAPPPAPATTAKPKPSPTPSAAGPRAVTEKFLTAMRSGDRVTMQQQLCGLLRDDQTASGSKAPDAGFSIFSLGTLASFKIGEEKVNMLGASVGVELTLPLFGTGNWEVYLVREGGGWRVCGARPV